MARSDIVIDREFPAVNRAIPDLVIALPGTISTASTVAQDLLNLLV
jgi:hypothetical protein